MSVVCRRTTVVALCLAALAAHAHAASSSDTIRTHVTGLLTEADAAATPANAETKLTQAEAILNDPKTRLPITSRFFLRAELYQTRGRVYARAWKTDRRSAVFRQKAYRASLRALDEYDRLTRALEDDLNRIEKKLNYKDPTKNADWRRVGGELSRANYREAWTLYNLGVVALTPNEQKTYLHRALDVLEDFTDEGYRAHPIVVQCFLAQALCHYELKDYSAVLKTLEKATWENTPKEAFKRMIYLRVRSHQALDADEKAEGEAEGYFRKREVHLKPDAMELQIILARVRSLAALTDPKAEHPDAKRYRERLDKYSKVLYQQGSSWRAELARILGKRGRVSAFTFLVQARELFSRDRFAEAARAAGKGLALNDPDTTVLRELHFTKAASHFNGGDWRRAHEAAFDFIRRFGEDRRSPKMFTRALEAGLKALKGDPKLKGDAFRRFLTYVEKRFPKAEGVAKADWYRANLLLEERKFTEARSLLSAVRPASPAYLLAQYGLALATYKEADAAARAEKPDTNRVVRLLTVAAEAVDRFVAAAATKKLDTDETEAAKTVVDVAVATARRMLRLPKPRGKDAVRLLDRIDALTALRGRAAGERTALRLQANIMKGSVDDATKTIKTLIAQRDESRHVVYALANVVTMIEETIDRAALAGRDAEVKRLSATVVEIYAFLLRYAGKRGDETLAAQEDAMRQRLARALERTGDYERARALYAWLLKRRPRDKSGDALRGLAFCRQKLGEHEKALELWRELAGGLERKTAGWYEARYHLILCRKEMGDTEQARALLEYFLVQNPKIEVAPWNRRFRELARELKLAEDD